MKLTDLINKMQKSDPQASQNKEDDGRFWKPTKDKTGNALALIRFLPNGNSDELPYVRIYNHGFQTDTGKWFIEECPTTIGKDCPVCEANRALYKTGLESDKKIAGDRKRKVTYIANILVIQDPENKAAEGRVFLYKFGQKIFDKLTAAISPAFADETPFSPFDTEEGRNFKLKVTGSKRDTNYDASAFSEKTTDVSDRFKNSDLFDLTEFVKEEKFLDFDAMEKKFNSVLNSKPVTRNAQDFTNDMSDSDFIRSQTQKQSSKVVDELDDLESDFSSTKTKAVDSKVEKAPSVSDDMDDDYFANLAKNLDD